MSRLNLIGKIVRLPLKLIPKNAVVTFIYGDLKGMKWNTSSSNHGYWLGLYERAVRRELKKHLSKGDTLLDLGAHVGYFSLFGSTLVGEKGKVFAFEPLPANLYYLKQHLVLNKINNVKLFEAAVAHFEGSFKMSSESRVGARLSDDGTTEVKVISLRKSFEDGSLPIPQLIKIDIEGEEKFLLEDIKDYLEKYNISLLLSTHGKETHTFCLKLLSELNYSCKPLDSGSLDSCTELLAIRK